VRRFTGVVPYDLHGSVLMKALYKEDVNANIRFGVAINAKKLAAH
jgi:hypothetical protein